MRIVIDYRLLFRNYFAAAYSRYVEEALHSLQKAKPEISFCFLADRFSRPESSIELPGEYFTIKSHWIKWPEANPGQDRQIAAILKRTEADLFLTTGAVAVAGIDIPQAVWIPGMQPDQYLKKKYFDRVKKKLPETFRHAAVLFTDREENTEELIRLQPEWNKKLQLIPPVADESLFPLPWTDKEKIKINYANGREYFLLVQTDFSLPDLINLLKAFAQFKKRQKSNLQMLIVGREAKTNKAFSLKKEAFKYRDDTLVYHDFDEAELRKIKAAAYAWIQPPGAMNDLLHAFRVEVPVIVHADEQGTGKTFADAVLHGSWDDPGRLAGQLILLYKDETVRNELIKKAKEKLRQFTAGEQQRLLWGNLENVINRGRPRSGL